MYLIDFVFILVIGINKLGIIGVFDYGMEIMVGLVEVYGSMWIIGVYVVLGMDILLFFL